MALSFYTPEGKTITLEEWMVLFSQRDHLHYVTTTDFGFTVSTVWLGMSENNWEVGLIDDFNDGDMTIVARLCCNTQEAKLFHEEWVSKVNRGIWRRRNA